MSVFLLLLTSLLFRLSSGYYVMPDEVYIAEAPGDSVVCEGCRVELTCTILRQTTTRADLPQPEIEWTFNGTDVLLLISEAQIQSISVQNTTGNFTVSVLSIPNAQLEHQGLYRCIVVDGNSTTHCHSEPPPRFPCVPLVTVSREAKVEILVNTTGGEGNSVCGACSDTARRTHVVTSHRETKFIGPRSQNGIELSCRVDASGDGSNVNVVWYDNGEVTATAAAERHRTVNGTNTQLYGVYQCFASTNGSSNVEVTIIRVLPYGLTNPPSVPWKIVEIPRANQNVDLIGLQIEWDPPLFTGNLTSDSLQYEVTLNFDKTSSSDAWVETFYTVDYLNDVHVAVISSAGNISENGPRAAYDVRGHCHLDVRFPPDLTVSCSDGGINVAWSESDRNEPYSSYEHSRIYYLDGQCIDSANRTTMPVNAGEYTSALILTNHYEVGTRCWFSAAATIPYEGRCYNESECTFLRKCCYCYDPYFIEYSAQIACDVTASVRFENVTYFAQENATSIEVCVIAEGYGFTVDIATVDGKAKGGEDFTVLNQQLSFDRNVRMHCINISIYDDTILEYDETFQVVLSGANVSLVDVTTESAEIEIKDDDYVTAMFTVSSSVTTEGGPPLEVCVQLPSIEKNVTLYVKTSSNTAEVEEDISIEQHSLEFTPASIPESQCVNIAIIDDDVLEYRESFTVALDTSNTSRVLTSEDSFEIHIEDNDVVTVALSGSSYSAGEGRESPSVCAAVTGTLGRNVSVIIGAENDTAISGEDYVLSDRQFRFYLGHHSDCVNVTIVDDDVMEESERFAVMLGSPDSGGVVVSNQPAIIEIEDDDYVTVSFTASEYTVVEPTGGSNRVNVCVEIGGRFARAKPVEVFLEVTEDSASNGSDYTAVRGDDVSFQFRQNGPAVLCRDSIIQINGDDIIEYEEEFAISLSLPPSENSVQLGDNSRADIMIQDNSVCSTNVYFDDTNQYNVHFDRVNRRYYVRPHTALTVIITLTTTCQLERDIEVMVETSRFNAKENVNYVPLETTLGFNDTVRSAYITFKILELPSNKTELDFIIRIKESDLMYFDTTHAFVIIEGPNPILSAVEGAVLGTMLGLLVFLIITSVFIATLCLYPKLMQRKKDLLEYTKELQDLNSPDPIDVCSPPYYESVITKEDRLSVILYLDFSSKTHTGLTSSEDSLVNLEESSEHHRNDLNIMYPQRPLATSGSPIAGSGVAPKERKHSGSNSSRTDSSASRPYVPFDSCSCSQCVSQKYPQAAGENINSATCEQVPYGGLDVLPIETNQDLLNPLEQDQQSDHEVEASLNELKYVNTAPREEHGSIGANLADHGTATLSQSFDQPRSLDVDVNHERFARETGRSPRGVGHNLVIDFEETDLAPTSFEAASAPQQAGTCTSAGCGQAMSDGN